MRKALATVLVTGLFLGMVGGTMAPVHAMDISVIGLIRGLIGYSYQTVYRECTVIAIEPDGSSVTVMGVRVECAAGTSSCTATPCNALLR